MSPFETAFAAARKAGKTEFTFKGKKYNTKLKSGGSAGPKARPKAEAGPKARPRSLNGGVSLPKSADVKAPRQAAGTPSASTNQKYAKPSPRLAARATAQAAADKRRAKAKREGR